MNKMMRTAIVTGAARGIGHECARALFEDGCNVVLADIDEQSAKAGAEAIEPTGTAVCGIKTDVSSVESIEALIAQTVERFGGIDILVNNAGIISTSAVEDVSLDEWERVMRINLTGAFFMAQKALEHLKKSNNGKIVNIASLAGRNGGISVGAPYAVSKAGMIGLTKSLASKLAQYNINVNCIAPGTTKTDILSSFTQDDVEHLESCIPLKRLGQPKDIANSVVFLASEKSSFITGTVIDVNGGMYIG